MSLIKERERIFLSSPHMGGDELLYVHEAFDSNYIAPVGKNLDDFEQAIKEYVQTGYALGTNSGTSAIHLALIALGVGPGDIVLCQSFTFAASANPILYLGALPVFIDSEADTWNMDPVSLETAIQHCMDGTLKEMGKHPLLASVPPKKPKAIIPVHLYGMPAKMNEIKQIADQYEIPIIEDAAEALGSKIGSEYCGTFGKMGVFSFNGNKIITTSSGGALISENQKLIEYARKLSTQARDNAIHYQHSLVGYNYRLSNVLAGIGIGQMKVLDERIAKRRANFAYYKKHLGHVNGITFLNEPEGFFSNRWLSTILLDKEKTGGIGKDEVLSHLADLNIETRPLWKPMHLQPVFEQYPFIGPGYSDLLFESGLCLPSGSNLNEEQLDIIISAILSLF